MKFNMTHLGYRQTPDFPYDYRIELVQWSLEQRARLTVWLRDSNIPHTITGWIVGNVIYLQEKDATLFALKYS